MTTLGELALWISLPIAAWGTILAFLGGRQQRGDLVLSGERAVYAVFFLLILSSLGIMEAFLEDRFEYWYVANYSNRELDTFFKVSGLWAGQRGSLVFWALLLSFFSSLAVFTNRAKNREFMPYVTGTLLSITTFFLIVLLFADVNPFERLPFTPANGQGLNPQLQNYWMTIHPPTLYLGFTAFAVPFAFAVSALLSGRLDSRWLQATRRWTLLSWFFLTNGIIFGMRWAYEELGWGGYWFWDPVENASLLPWITATAFLHSVIIQENRGMLKIWNMALVSLTFLLTIFATFLTRSGLIESVHTFAQNTQIAFIFLFYMGLVLGVCTILILWRREHLSSEREIESFISKEAAFLFNNLVLLGSAFAVLWGTLFPLITEGLTGQTISVGPPFFNAVNLPIGLTLLALSGVGPVIAWRKATPRNLIKNFRTPVLVGAGVVLGFLAVGARDPWALTTFGLSAFVLTIITTEFYKGTRARSRIESSSYPVAFYHLVTRNRRRWGGYIVHVGMVMIFTAFAGSAFNVEVQQAMDPGDVVEATSPFGHTYALTYEGISSSREPNMFRWVATLSVEKNGEPYGVLTTEKRRYTTAEQPVTEVGIRSSALEDLYLILASVEDMRGVMTNNPDAERMTLQVLIKPLVGWIWFGGLVISVGTLIALWPTGDAVRRKPPARTVARPAEGVAA